MAKNVEIPEKRVRNLHTGDHEIFEGRGGPQGNFGSVLRRESEMTFLYLACLPQLLYRCPVATIQLVSMIYYPRSRFFLWGGAAE